MSEEDTSEEDTPEEDTSEEDTSEEDTPEEDTSEEDTPEEAEFEEAELEEAIAEDPEAVAAFVRRLDAVNELLDVLALGENALTDEMVRDLAGTTATLAESADGLATDETVGLAEAVGENGEELQEALQSLVVLQRTGSLNELIELADVASLLTAALDDEMVTSLAGTGASLGELADSAADDDARDGIETMLTGLSEAESEEPERVGPVGLLKATRDPDVQYGFGYLLAIAQVIGRSQSQDETE